MVTKDVEHAVPGFFDGTTNAELKQQALSRLVRHLSRSGGDELEQEKLDVINAALDSLDELNTGSEHLAERSRPRPEVKERAPAACPPWGALVTDDLPRRLELLEELKNVSVHKLGGSGNGRIDEKKVTPYAWAAFLVAPMEGLEEMTCMAALVAAATPEGVGEEDSELDARDRQRLIREWVEKTERAAGDGQQEDR